MTEQGECFPAELGVGTVALTLAAALPRVVCRAAGLDSLTRGAVCSGGIPVAVRRWAEPTEDVASAREWMAWPARTRGTVPYPGLTAETNGVVDLWW